ncbi:hypothetical protein LJR296_007494 [Cupriavidus necator]|uniref:hypothetical protein n=1 Tax=Cupriavidus necator TaxID=106590 RepID=UPI003ECE43EA
MSPFAFSFGRYRDCEWIVAFWNAAPVDSCGRKPLLSGAHALANHAFSNTEPLARAIEECVLGRLAIFYNGLDNMPTETPQSLAAWSMGIFFPCPGGWDAVTQLLNARMAVLHGGVGSGSGRGMGASC